MRKLFTMLILLFLWAGSSWAQNLNEGFEGTTFPPEEWTLTNLGDATTWTRYTTNPHAGVGCASIVYSATAHNDWLITPKLVPAAGNSTISFWARNESSSYIERFNVLLSTTDNITTSFTVSLASNVGPGTTYTQYTYDLSPYIGSNVYVAIQAISTDMWRLYIDDVTGPPIFAAPIPPNCATLTSPADAAVNVGIGATLNWASGGGAPTGYKLYFGTNASPAYIGDIGNVTTYNPTPDMSYATTYYWKVVPYNANGDATGCPTWSFTTGPDPTISAFPYTNGFEDAGFPPYGWSQLTVSGTNVWARTTTSPHSGTACAIAPWASLGGEHLLITPPLNLTNKNYRLKFWLKGSSLAGTDLTVQIATSNSSASNFSTDLLTFVAGTNMPTAWAEQIVDLSAYENIQYIAFRMTDLDGYSLYIDDVTIEEIQAVPPSPVTMGFPLNSLVTLNNPMLSWTASLTGEPATGFRVYLDGNASPTTLVYDGTALSYQTTGLVAGNTYYWKVVPYNANGDATGVVTYSFSVVANGYLAESFESTTFPPVGWANPGSWARSTFTYISGLASAYKFTATTESLLRTPLLTITGSSTLKFFAQTTAANTGQWIQVKYSADGTTWTNVGAAINLPQNGPMAPYSVDLSSLSGNNYYLAIATYYVASSGSVYIDHIVGPMVTQLTPNAVTLVAPADLAIDLNANPTLSWTAALTGGIPTGYKVYIDENPNPTTLYATVTASPYVVSPPLDYATTYYWKVTAFNANGDAPASAVRSFTTKADPTVTPPYTQDFATFPGVNWSSAQGILANPVVFTATTSSWVADGFANVGTTGSSRLNIYSTTYDEWMITPPINLGDGSIDYQLRFDLALTAYASTGPAGTTGVDDKFAVVISTDNGATWSSANTLRLWDNAGSSFVYNEISNTGETIILDLSAYSGIVQIAFYGESTISNADNDLFVDNVIVQVPPLTGNLSGVVRDCYTTTPISGATVTLGSYTTTTNASGFYEFTSVDIGSYTLSGSFTGYNTTTVTGVTVLSNQTTTQNFCLNIFLPIPANFSGTVSAQDIHLAWDAPGTPPNGQWITWNGANAGNSIGTNAAAIFDVASRWPVADIAAYNGMYLRKVRFYPFEASCTYTIKVWKGANAGTLLHSQVVTSPVIGAMNEVTLSSLITIDGADELWFGFESNTTTGYPAGCDEGPEVAGKGNMINLGGTWSELTALNVDLTYNWNLEAYVSSTAMGPVMAMTIQPNAQPLAGTDNLSVYASAVSAESVADVNKGTFKAALPNHARIENSSEIVQKSIIDPQDGIRAPLSTLTGYNVYRNAVEIAHNTALATEIYNDLNRPAGTYSYTVTAQYLEGESGPAGPVVLTVITCDAPINLTAAVTLNSAVLGWTPQGPASLWNVEWGVKGFVQGTGTMVNTGSPTTTITGLTPGVEYDFYVRSYCNSTDQSAWSGPKSFRTHFFNCPAGSVAEAEACGDDTNGGCNMDTPAFEPISIGQTICGTSWQNGGLRDTDWFTFTLAATSDVSFSGTGDFNIVVGFIASPCPATAFIVSASALAGNTATVTTQLAAGTYYAFVGAGAGTFYCGEGDRYQATLTGTSCLRASGLTAANITTSSADLSWTSPGVKWSIEYGETGFVQGTSGGTIVEDITSPAYALSGLSGSTSYTYYVMTDCGGETSYWSLPYSFSTACVPLTLPYSENFDAVTAPAIPACMSVSNVNADAVTWVTSTSLPNSLPNSMRISYNTDLAMDDWFFTPSLSLTPGTYNVSFWFRNSGVSFPEALEVKWGTSPDAAGMTSAAIFDNSNITNAVYQEGTGVITITSAGTYYVGWHGYSDADMFYLNVDDITIVSAAPPTKTLNLTNVRLEHLFVAGNGGMMNQAYNATGPQFTAPTADAITVELHDAANYGTILRTYPGVQLSTSGTASVPAIDLPDGNYRITIKHRNSIETTSVLVDFTGATVAYSFGTAASAFGNNLKLIDGFYCIIGGDVNQDGQVEGLDVTLIENGVNTFLKGYVATDVDGSGDLGITDYTIWENNNNTFRKRVVPTP